MNHEEIQDLLAPFALGAISDGERAAVEGHLTSCDECRRTLKNFQSAASALPYSIPPVAPPSRVKARLMASVRPRRSFSWMNSLALAASVLLLVGLSWIWRQRSVSRLEIVSASGSFQADGRSVSSGDKVRFNQTLATGENPQADIRLASRAVFHLNSGSEVVVARAGNGYVVDLKKGAVLSVVKTGTAYAVKTNLVTASALGTIFYVQMDSSDKTSVCICRGRFHLEGLGYSQDMAGEHHNGASLQLIDGAVRSVPHGRLDHSDQGVEALSALLR